MNVLTSIFKPPVFEDEEKTSKAYLLNIILWSLIVVPIPYLTYFLIANPEMISKALIETLVGESVNIFLLILMRRGYVQLASGIQTVAFWTYFTVTALMGSGIQDEAYVFGYPLVILIAGLLLGTRFAVGFTVLSLISGLSMIYMQETGILTVLQYRPIMLTWVISLVFFPVTATIQYLTSRIVTNALLRAKQSEEKYRLIAKVSSDYVFESRINDKGEAETIWLGGAFEKMTGYTAEEYIQAGGWYAHIHPDDLVKDEEDIRTLERNQDVLGSEIRTFAKNGDIRWERIFAHPIWDEKKNRLTGIIGAVQDITAQKEAEKQLQDTLRQQDAILNNIPDMAWLKDETSRYIAVNEEFLRVSGKTETDILGKTDAEIWESHFADLYRQDDLAVIESGVRKTLEELQKDNTGREYWVETTKTPIRDRTGRVIGTAGIAREISERKQAEMEREKWIEELGKKNAELERFTYTVSHDLKSPLVTITGFLGYLDQDARAGQFDKFSRDLERIRQAVEKMQTLLNDLLELSRIGRIIHDPVEEEFGSIVRDALALLNGLITQRKVQIEYEDKGCTVVGDRIRLVEVLQNLIENAVKFMGPNTDPKVRIGAIKGENNTPVFFVEDNGIGIDPQYHDRVFGLFNKLDSTSEGSGIGLTLVKRIIEVHNGRVWFESQPGKGTTFFFTLAGAKAKE